MDAVIDKTASMGEIASANGFAGASYFSETFRKEMGCSPADYRKWYRGLIKECPVIAAEIPEKENASKKSGIAAKKNVPSYLL